MLGYDDDEIEPHVSAFERLIHPDDLARATRLNTSVSRGDKPYEIEFLRHKDGHYVQVLSRGYPVRREPEGPVVRIVGTHFDLTERKEGKRRANASAASGRGQHNSAGWSSRRKTNGGASRGRCTTSLVSR